MTAALHEIGEVIQIHIAPVGRAPMQSRDRVRALPERGLEGDRYFNGSGTFIGKGKLPKSQEATLVTAEAIEAFAAESGLALRLDQTRRNLVTRCIDLNALVGFEFTVGPVRMKGIKLCEPCAHLESLTMPGVKLGLAGCGGLRAQILSEGVISVGDRVAAVAPSGALQHAAAAEAAPCE